jgi:hypothetical protein
MSTITFTRGWTTMRGTEEVDLTLTIEATAGGLATRVSPEEPAEYEVTARDAKGREVELSEADRAEIQAMCPEWAADEWVDREAEYVDARLDAIRDGDA